MIGVSVAWLESEGYKFAYKGKARVNIYCHRCEKTIKAQSPAYYYHDADSFELIFGAKCHKKIQETLSHKIE